MAKHCTNCGHELQGTEKFCAECGAPTGQAGVGGRDMVDTVRQIRRAHDIVREEERASREQSEKEARRPGCTIMTISGVGLLIGGFLGGVYHDSSVFTIVITVGSILVFAVGFLMWLGHR